MYLRMEQQSTVQTIMTHIVHLAPGTRSRQVRGRGVVAAEELRRQDTQSAATRAGRRIPLVWANGPGTMTACLPRLTTALAQCSVRVAYLLARRRDYRHHGPRSPRLSPRVTVRPTPARSPSPRPGCQVSDPIRRSVRQPTRLPVFTRRRLGCVPPRPSKQVSPASVMLALQPRQRTELGLSVWPFPFVTGVGRSGSEERLAWRLVWPASTPACRSFRRSGLWRRRRGSGRRLMPRNGLAASGAWFWVPSRWFRPSKSGHSGR